MAIAPAPHPDAPLFMTALQALRSDEEREKLKRYFKTGEGDYGAGDIFIGVRMGQLFDLAKAFVAMDPAEIETLLESDIHEARAGAMSIMAKQYQYKKTPEERRKALYELYLRRHDRINNWDLVDLAAYKVVGPWLADKPRDPLYTLARSGDMWERRTGMLATMAYVLKGDVEDGLAIAEILLNDDQDLVHKAAGWVLREVGRKHRPRLIAFLDAHAAVMPRVMLRNAIEHFDPDQRQHYLGLAKAAR